MLVATMTYSWMPVKFPYTLWLNHDVGRSNRLGDGEVGRVNLPPLAGTTRRRLRGMLESTVDVGSISGELATASRNVSEFGGLASGTVLDIRVLLRKLVKS